MIAIHHVSGSFSDRWIEYCSLNTIQYKLVDAYSDTILEDLNGCDIFLWHWNHLNYKDHLFARQLIISLERKGLKVFPNFDTCWHFDDKVGQKYLLEAIDAPLVTTNIFYDKTSALSWAKTIVFPVVFKLRGGAGATNVRLVKNYSECKALIKRAFKDGFSQYRSINGLKERLRLFKKDSDLMNLIKGVGRLFFKPHFAKMMNREKGYVYFQKFIPNNTYDIRIIVISNKAFGVKRYTRKNDFRASGSGDIEYGREVFDTRCVKIAFETALKLNTQSVAFDFVFDKENIPLIVEISFGFSVSAYDNCPGFWTPNLEWHEGAFKPQFWIIEDLLNK